MMNDNDFKFEFYYEKRLKYLKKIKKYFDTIDVEYDIKSESCIINNKKLNIDVGLDAKKEIFFELMIFENKNTYFIFKNLSDLINRINNIPYIKEKIRLIKLKRILDNE